MPTPAGHRPRADLRRVLGSPRPSDARRRLVAQVVGLLGWAGAGLVLGAGSVVLWALLFGPLGSGFVGTGRPLQVPVVQEQPTGVGRPAVGAGGSSAPAPSPAPTRPDRPPSTEPPRTDGSASTGTSDDRGSHDSRSGNRGSGNSGSDDSASDDSGSDDSGSGNSGSGNSGSDDSGSGNSGSDDSGSDD